MTTAFDEILSLLTEDCYGPWEIAIQVPVSRGALVDGINDLLQQGLIEWFMRRNDSAPAVPLRQVGGDLPSLSDESVWATPSSLDSMQKLLGATDSGRRAYFGVTDSEVDEAEPS